MNGIFQGSEKLFNQSNNIKIQKIIFPTALKK